MTDLYQKLLKAYEIREHLTDQTARTIDDMAQQREELINEIAELKRKLRRRDEMLAKLTSQLNNILGGE